MARRGSTRGWLTALQLVSLVGFACTAARNTDVDGGPEGSGGSPGTGGAAAGHAGTGGAAAGHAGTGGAATGSAGNRRRGGRTRGDRRRCDGKCRNRRRRGRTRGDGGRGYRRRRSGERRNGRNRNGRHGGGWHWYGGRRRDDGQLPVPGAPDVQDSRSRLHLRDRSGMRLGGTDLLVFVTARQLRAGRQWMLLFRVLFDVHQRRLQRRGRRGLVLHQRLHRRRHLRDEHQRSDLRVGKQRLRGRGDVVLHVRPGLRTARGRGLRRSQLGGVAGSQRRARRAPGRA